MEESQEIRENLQVEPKFIRSYEVIEKVGPVAYRLTLPPELEKIHNVFHVSMLRRYRSYQSHVVSSEVIELRPDLTYEEEPVEILTREVKELRNKLISLVKVLWRNHKTENVTPILKHISFKPFQICRSIFVHYSRPINI